MAEEEKNKSSEDMYTGTQFEDDESDTDELKSVEFIEIEPVEVKIEKTATENISKFFGENKKLLAEKIIEKKSGKIIEIKYDELGNKKLVTERDKDKKVKKCTDYHANGKIKMVTEYGLNKSYKLSSYNIDGSRHSQVIKHPDGTSDAVYFDADKKGTNLYVKMDASKNVIEKRTEKP